MASPPIEVCNERHSSLWRAITLLTAVLAAIVGLIVYSITRSQCAETRAAQAEQTAVVQSAKEEEFRTFVKGDLVELKSWTRNVSRKQDELSLALQRLMTIHENPQREREPAKDRN
jgi:hypothetical protein